MADKRPAFQFYPGDWMKDPDLRRCGRAARGMWIDILCLMFECSDRGVLATGGVPWTDQEIAAAVGGDISDGVECVAELLRKGVAYRNQAGAIFCKRMVRDEQIRKARSEAGKLGGNPGLLKQNASKPKAKAKQKTTPSSSSSSSSSEEKKKGTPSESPAAGTPRPPGDSPHARAVAAFCEAWGAKYGERYPFGRGKDGAAVQAILSHLAGDVEKFTAAVGRYLADPDPFVAGHTLGMFRSQLAKWLTDRPSGSRGPAGGHLDHAGKQELRVWSQIAESLPREES